MVVVFVVVVVVAAPPGDAFGILTYGEQGDPEQEDLEADDEEQEAMPCRSDWQLPQMNDMIRTKKEEEEDD